MDDRYIQEVARLIARADARGPRACELCGGREVLTAAVPLDPDTIGVAAIAITYCRACDGGDPAVAEMFARLDAAADETADDTGDETGGEADGEAAGEGR
ncbi:hypothetical protein ACSNOI_01870 [Actinomadura kijaniata]|uniref:hypothetical protein n=1 Tax=Actinomadura kijaniata TaxID=46161 RepID=UPI003F1DDD1A